jgi:hypothetical protein
MTPIKFCYPVALGLLLGVVPHCSSAEKELIALSPEVASAECPASLVTETGSISGSPSYVFIARELIALEMGHHASSEFFAALSPSALARAGADKQYTDTRLTRSAKGYLCASFLAGEMKQLGGGSSQETLVHSLTSSLKVLAIGSLELRAQMNVAAGIIEKGQKPISPTASQDITRILQERKEMQGGIADAAAASAWLMVDLSGEKDALADTLKMSQEEREELLRRVSTLAGSTPADEFTLSAWFLQEFLKKYRKCEA